MTAKFHYLRSKSSFLVATVIASLLLFFITSCNTADLAAVDTALNDLVQNKNLAEQFVRDLKMTVEPSDPTYQRLVQDYEAARACYDDYLDSVKSPVTRQNQIDLNQLSEDAKSSAADFLEQATRSLRPTINTRRIHFQRAIVLPEDLTQVLQKFPKNRRNQLIRQFETQVRWRSWRQL
jgi:hypothetical protein